MELVLELGLCSTRSKARRGQSKDHAAPALFTAQACRDAAVEHAKPTDLQVRGATVAKGLNLESAQRFALVTLCEHSIPNQRAGSWKRRRTIILEALGMQQVPRALN